MPNILAKECDLDDTVTFTVCKENRTNPDGLGAV